MQGQASCERTPDYYAVLEVSASASASEIRAAFRRLLRTWHPDVCKHPSAKERTCQILEGWEILRDPAKKSSYDCERRRAEEAAQAGYAAPGHATPPHDRDFARHEAEAHRAASQAADSPLSDLLELFGSRLLTAGTAWVREKMEEQQVKALAMQVVEGIASTRFGRTYGWPPDRFRLARFWLGTIGVLSTMAVFPAILIWLGSLLVSEGAWPGALGRVAAVCLAGIPLAAIAMNYSDRCLEQIRGQVRSDYGLTGDVNWRDFLRDYVEASGDPSILNDEGLRREYPDPRRRSSPDRRPIQAVERSVVCLFVLAWAHLASRILPLVLTG